MANDASLPWCVRGRIHYGTRPILADTVDRLRADRIVKIAKEIVAQIGETLPNIGHAEKGIIYAIIVAKMDLQ